MKLSFDVVIRETDLIFLGKTEGTDFFSRRFVKINLSPVFGKKKNKISPLAADTLIAHASWLSLVRNQI